MKYILAVLLAGLASGVSASDLPDCVGDDTTGLNNCVGAITHPNGDRYVGEFKDNKSDGQGTYTYANGDKYVGEFKDGKRNGQGTYTFANGDKYVGEFKDNKPNGQGTYTYADGSMKEGIWNDNEFLGTVAEVEAAAEKAECTSTACASWQIATEKQKAEEILTRQYQSIIESLEKAGEEDEITWLKKSQEGWLLYQENTCELEQSIRGGINNINWVRCTKRLTEVRQEEIEEMYNYYEQSDERGIISQDQEER